MKVSPSDDPDVSKPRRRVSQWWYLVLGWLLIALVAMLLIRSRKPAVTHDPEAVATAAGDSHQGPPRHSLSIRPNSNPATGSATAKTAEEIVAGKLTQFARSRRALAHALARRAGVKVPDAVEQFFDAVESGNWDAIDTRFKALSGGDKTVSHGPRRPPEVNEMWSAISDAYGVAEQVHDWPAQKLLDYGNAVLDSLRPGMVYVGGTDNGRWIPELLNDTSEGEPHIIVTQNGFADGKYLEYIAEQYGDRFSTLTQEDSQHAFDTYLADARKRLQHDQQFPDEPKQVRPGENLNLTDGRLEVSGQTAVMAINEKLLQSLMAKNPDLSFAIQESRSLPGTYGNAVPLGPLMELNVSDASSTFTPERATASLDYWRAAAQNMLADPEAINSPVTLKSYAHDANSTANLLAAHDYPAAAEQAYGVALQLWPDWPESISGLATLYAQTGRADEARRLVDDFARKHPEQPFDIETVRGSITWTPSPKKP